MCITKESEVTLSDFPLSLPLIEQEIQDHDKNIGLEIRHM